ncbi:MAG: alpha/beta fold hydrolase [Desulfomonile tiedjei]|nr:alpha/beta fold hydrolase [Desulfomonile tiedjei]
MPEVSVRGRKLAFEVKPETFDRGALAVVCIHGTAGDREDWRFQLDGLSGRFTVIALELPGHGASDPPDEPTVPEFAQAVEVFVETLGLQRVVLVGCSLGSAITQWLALSPKPWLVGIGLVGAGARLRVHPALREGVLQDKDTAVDLFADFALGASPDPALRQLVREKFLHSSAELIYRDLTACNDFDVMERVGQVSLPTCIIVGEEDKLTPPKYAQFLHKAIAGSSLTTIPGAGHLVMVEKPAEFNASLSAFLGSLDRARTPRA